MLGTMEDAETFRLDVVVESAAQPGVRATVSSMLVDTRFVDAGPMPLAPFA